MKKWICLTLCVAFLVCGVFAMPTKAAESVDISMVNQVQGSERWKVITIAVTAAANGLVTSTAFNLFPEFARDITAHIQYAITDPGSTAPTDNYDITITDSSQGSDDVFGAELMNRDTTNTESVEPAIPYRRVNLKNLVFNLSGNSVDSATFTVYIYVYVRGD